MYDRIFKGRGKLQVLTVPHRARIPAMTPAAKGKDPPVSQVWRALMDPKSGRFLGRKWQARPGSEQVG